MSSVYEGLCDVHAPSVSVYVWGVRGAIEELTGLCSSLVKIRDQLVTKCKDSKTLRQSILKIDPLEQIWAGERTQAQRAAKVVIDLEILDKGILSTDHRLGSRVGLSHTAGRLLRLLPYTASATSSLFYSQFLTNASPVQLQANWDTPTKGFPLHLESPRSPPSTQCLLSLQQPSRQ